MKNFTNNFKQFTSRLSARWLIMTLMLLMGTSSVWGWTVIYDNTDTKWDEVYLYVGKDDWSECNLKMTEYDKNLFVFKGSGWDDAKEVVFADKALGGSATGSICTRLKNDNAINPKVTYSKNKDFSKIYKYKATGLTSSDANCSDEVRYYWPDNNSMVETTFNGNVIQLAGNFNDWGSSTDYCVSTNNSTCSFEKELTAADNYQFKIVIDGVWYSGNTVTVDGDKIQFQNPWNNNSSFTASNDGIYTFNVDKDKKVWITYRTSCTAPTTALDLSKEDIVKCADDVLVPGTITINNYSDYNSENVFYLGDTEYTYTTISDNGGKIGGINTSKEYTVSVAKKCGTSYSEKKSTNITIESSNVKNTPTLEITPIVKCGTSYNPGELKITNYDENYIYTISPTLGTPTINGNIATYVINGNSEIEYTVTATHKTYSTCSSPATQKVTITDNSATIAAETAINQNFCTGDVITLTVTEGQGTYNWVSTNGGQVISQKTNSVTVTQSGTYTVTATNASGCVSNEVVFTVTDSGVMIHASGSTTLGADKFAALYVTDCSGKEIDAYQWEYCRTQDGDYQPYSSVCSYTFEKKDVVKTETSDAGKTNNIRPSEFGYYRCKVTYKDGTTATSATEHILGSYSRSFTSNIPVLVVNTGSKGFPDCTGLSNQTASKNASTFKAKRSVDVKIYEGETLVYDRKARMNYRGSSSLNFVKKSYAFCPGDANCEEKDGQADYVKTAKLNMLGVGQACDKDWVLYAAAADPSLMRNRLVFDSFKAMTGKWGVNSRYVELIVDGVYKGVYVFMDKITMNTERVEVDEDKGFIVKFDKTDREDRVGGLNGVLGDEKTFKTSYTGEDDIRTYDTDIDQRFEIEYPEKDDYKTGWKARVDGIQGMFQAFEDALKQGDYATVQKYIDYTSWADWFIINEFTKNVDAYRASCIFVYTGEAGAKIEARPLWDQELSFNNQASKGTSDKGSNSTAGLLIQHSNVYSDAFGAPFWFTGGGSEITGGLLSDPCFVQVVKERWNMHQSGALSKKSLEDLVDEYEDDLAPEGTTENAQTRETTFWDGKSRGKCDCSYETSNATATGYQNKTFEESKGTITNWISDDAASGAKGRRAGLTTAINGLTGASFSIQIIPSEAYTTPWEPVEIAVSVTPAGYDYKLEYTGDNNLGGVANTIIKEEGDKITYRIPRPDAWGTGNESVEGERTDIEYGIKATLSVQEGTTVCGSQAAPSSTGKIILQDEPNEKCD